MPRSRSPLGAIARRVLGTAAAGLLIAIPGSASAQGGQVVGVGGSSTLGNPLGWLQYTMGNGSIGVTTANPRVGYAGYGAGSLEMSVTGQAAGGQYPDWAFWYQYAGGNAASGASFGALSALSSLSFDWYRSYIPGWDAPEGSTYNENNQSIPPADWLYKTPVLRLILRENRGESTFLSELVWEGYYNQCSLGTNQDCSRNTTPIDQWVTQSGMQNGNFWYVPGQTVPDSNDPCTQAMSFWQGGVTASNTSGLLGEDGCLSGFDVDIIGIAVGVGSQWPLPYHGFVDNVRMGFAAPDQFARVSEGGSEAVNANFDFIPSTAVPEPSTYALMAAGLLAVGAAARRKRRRSDRRG